MRLRDLISPARLWGWVMPVLGQARDDGSGIKKRQLLKRSWIPDHVRNDEYEKYGVVSIAYSLLCGNDRGGMQKRPAPSTSSNYKWLSDRARCSRGPLRPATTKI